MPNTTLKLPALEINQGPGRTLYSFGIDGKLVGNFTTISRIRRNEKNTVTGYQRPEIIAHVAEIRRYLESQSPLIPNAIVIAFNDSVKFTSADSKKNGNGTTRNGTIEIPIKADIEDQNKPGWIVDGQQRVAAIREANISSYPIFVTAFIASSIQEQREQFILVNSTKPLPKGLIYELLPSTETHLPSALQRRRFPAQLLDRLNHDHDSPLRQLIKTPTVTEGIIKDNSILRMLENSLGDGALYRFRDPTNGRGDVDAMLSLLKSFWSAVAATFPDGWAVPPRRSRLMHGSGIITMGFLMDAISERYRHDEIPTEAEFIADLEPLKTVCRWTNGYWDFGGGIQRKWNDLQNTSRDQQLLANYLLLQYKRLVWNRGSIKTPQSAP